MNKLYITDQDQKVNCEIAAADYGKKFCRLIAADIAADLQTSYVNRDVVTNLLTTCLLKRLYGHGGMLEEYLHSQLDILAKTLRYKFEIDDDVKVNYKYATHAKFNDLLDIIIENQRAEHAEEDPYPGSI